MTMREKIRKLNRESRNGYETTFSVHYLSRTNYRWELIRYPLDVNSNEPTETVLIFEGRFNWDDAINAAAQYLKDHPDDGFYND